ncbi:hypothetical protein VBY74_11705 [Tenacibaculum ascidiaceicola]|uniref:hypothetical protein n=1 Tax=Tenacibaculum ascidiaceicola TaxID=1699411 RepID=UPI0039E7F05A
MKKSILNLGNALTKANQKQIKGGNKFNDPCPCTSSYTDNGDGSCMYPALFPEGFYCFGEIQGGQCCES